MPSPFSAMTDTELQVAADGLRGSLQAAWRRGEAGSALQLYDLARATAEAQVRGRSLHPLRDPAQLSIDDVLRGQLH
jgi:phytoene/squalene synthetase